MSTHDRFSDHSKNLTNALESASDRAWRALEIALAGETFLSWLHKAEDKAFREQVRAALPERLKNIEIDLSQTCFLDS